MEKRSKTFSDNFWSFRWPWLGTHVYKMIPTALDYHSISYVVHARCAPFFTVRIISIRRKNRRFSVKLAKYREEGVIYRSEKLASSHFTHIALYCQRKSEQQEIAIKQTVVFLSQSNPQLRYSAAATCVVALGEVQSPSLLPEFKDPEVDISI
ncbi:hypothetical protein TNCV_2347421 [Trichonephila clavipes]|nr:hypothetical protein TNCV_2347421 [Trichonephila clavipes]